MLTAKRFSTFVLLLALVLPLIGEPASWSFVSAQDEVAPADFDLDGVEDTLDNCYELPNGDQVDTDADGTGDACDPTPWGEPDTDGDGFPDNSDPTPNGDSDGDGIDELVDNCGSAPNSDQLDTDGDGIGDACDDTPLGDEPTDIGIEETAPPEEVESTAETEEADATRESVQPAESVTITIRFAAPDGSTFPGSVGGAGNCFGLRRIIDPESMQTENLPDWCDSDDGVRDGLIHGTVISGERYETRLLSWGSTGIGGCWEVIDSQWEQHPLNTFQYGMLITGATNVDIPVEPTCAAATSTSVVTETPIPSATASTISSSTPTATLTTVPGAIPVGSSVRTTASVVLRSGPGTSFERITTVPSGQTGTITGSPVAAGGYTWYPVTFPGYGSGYMAGNYLTSTVLEPTATTASGGFPVGSTVVTSARVNLRAAASTSSAVRAVVPSGTTATITGAPTVAGGYTWYPVDVPGYGSGYLASNYLRASSAPPTATSTAPPVTPTTTTGGLAVGATVITTASVNLRASASSSGTVRAVIAKGTTGTITGAGIKSGRYTWYPISIGGQSGYIAGNYLKLTTASAPTNTPAPSATPTPIANAIPPGTYVETTARVNVRSCAGTACAVLTTVNKGTGLTIAGAPAKIGSTLWYPVSYDGSQTGWISGAYLKVSPAPTPVQTATKTATQTATGTPTKTATPSRTATKSPTSRPDAPVPVPGETWYTSPGITIEIYACASYDCGVVGTWGGDNGFYCTGDWVRTDWATVWVPGRNQAGIEGWVPYYWPTDSPTPTLTPTWTPSLTPSVTPTVTKKPTIPNPPGA